MADPESILNTAIAYAGDGVGKLDGLVSSVENFLGAQVSANAPDWEKQQPYTGAAGYAASMMSLGVNNESAEFSGERPLVDNLDEPGVVTARVPTGGYTAMQQLSLSMPKMPLAFSKTFNRAEPGELPIVLPVMPNLPTYAPPTLVDPVFPDPVALSIPTANFGAINLPELVSPSNTFSFAPDTYSSILLDPLRVKLLDALENGTFIHPQLWNDTWNRARDRRTEAVGMELDDVTRSMARSGFALPNSHMIFIRNNILRKMTNELLDVDREMAIKEAEVHIENRKFTITEIRELEKISMDFFLRNMELVLNSMKAAMEIAVLLFEAEVKKHMALIEGYKLSHAQYLASIEGELKRVEAWKVAMEGVKIQVEAQSVRVDLFKAQLQGNQMLVEVYKAQMEGALATTKVNEARVNLFKAYVEAFAAEVAAKESEFKGFAAAAGAEGVKAEIMKAQASQYGAQAQAAMAEVQAARANLDAAIANNQIKADIYRSKVSLYGADVQKFQAEASFYGDKYRSQSQIRSSAISAVPSLFGAEVSGVASAQSANANITRAHSDFNATIMGNEINLLDSRGKAGIAAANTISGFVTGATGMVNGLAAYIKTEDATPAK